MDLQTSTQTLVLYDGACPVCNTEIEIVRRRDRANALRMIDIAALDFDKLAWPVSLAEMNASLHVRKPDGTWLKGMAATRCIYRAIGYGWLLAPTGWPLLSRLF